MKTFIYIKNDGIECVRRRGRRHKAKKATFEKGAILNGVIMNPTAIQNALRTIKPRLKKVTLVVDSSNIMVKKVQLPAVGQGRLQQIVKGEFDLFKKEGEFLFDANVLREQGTMDVMAYAASKQLIDSYRAVFRAVGIKIERIDVATNCIVKHLARKKDLSKKTFLFNVIVGENMLSILFEEGEYKLTNRVRLLQQGQEALYYQELYARLSSMIQFNQSQKSEHVIAKSYYIGLSPADMDGFATFANGLTTAEVLPYTDADAPAEYFFAAIAAPKNEHDVNFAIDKAARAKAKQTRKTISLRFFMSVLVLALLGLFASYQLGQRAAAKAENDTLYQYIEADSTIEGVATYDALEAAYQQANTEAATLAQVLENIENAKPLQKEVLNKIFAQDGVVDSFSYSWSGLSITLTATVESDQEAVAYAKALRAAGFFVEMQYNGHTVQEGAEDALLYQFTIDAQFDSAQEDAQ